MTADEGNRKLAAILAADVAGYSRLMADDERATVRTLTEYREVFVEHVEAHLGGIVDTAGDSVLATFDSVVEAVEAAVNIQRILAERNAQLPDHRRMHFRIGVNLGDIIVRDDGTIYGDGVNIAARLEGVATAGGVMASGTAYDQVKRKTAFGYEFLGERAVKNVPEPVRVYRVLGEALSPNEASTGNILGLPDKPSIAVLPLDNLGGDIEQDYFADGITEDLIIALSRMRWLFVTARNSTFTYKGRSTDVKRVGQELGVRYVVEGSVRRAGRRIRVTIQLIDARTGNHVWAERYDRVLDDIFVLQDEITETIAATIEPELAAVEMEQARRKPPHSLDAWEAYQRGMWHLYRFTADDNIEARRLFHETIDKDPEYGAAHAGLAYGHYLAHIIDYPDCDLDEALSEGRLGVLLDDRDAMAHFALGRVYMALGFLGDAVEELREAIEINPSFAIAHYALGYTSLLRGDLALAQSEVDTAVRLSPRDPVLWAFESVRAGALAFAGDQEGALESARRACRRPNADFLAYAWLAWIAGCLGDDAEALRAAGEVRRRKPEFTTELAIQRLGFVNPMQIALMETGFLKAGLEVFHGAAD